MIAAQIISPWTVYWITRLDDIQRVLAFVAVIGTIMGVAYTCYNVIELERRPPKIWLVVALVAFFVAGAVLTPSTKDACAIYLIPKIANNESVQEIGGDVQTLAHEWLEELRPKKAEPAKGE